MSNRPTTLQLETLVEFLEANIGVARGYLKSAQAKQDMKKKWAQLATQLNALGGVNKDGPGWAKYWAEKKCALKKLCARHAASMRQTGGGRGDTYVLSEIEKRLVAVMGGTTFATGDMEVEVNPFPQRMPTVETPAAIVMEEIVLEDGFVTPPPPPVAGCSQDESPDAAPPQADPAANLRQRPRRLPRRAIDEEMARLATIEERRVEAERLTAEAFANTSIGLNRAADAAEHIAQAISEVAAALHLIASHLSR